MLADQERLSRSRGRTYNNPGLRNLQRSDRILKLATRVDRVFPGFRASNGHVANYAVALHHRNPVGGFLKFLLMGVAIAIVRAGNCRFS